jgi:hypothetical protein
VSVVGAEEEALGAARPLVTDPNVGENPLQDVSEVERAVRVGKSGRDEECAWHRRESARRLGVGGAPTSSKGSIAVVAVRERPVR